jgi:hypothetical protein
LLIVLVLFCGSLREICRDRYVFVRGLGCTATAVYLTTQLARPLTMLTTSPGRIAVLTAIAAIALVGFSAPAAIGETDSSLSSDNRDRTCGPSTDTIKQLATIEDPAEGSFQCLGLSVEGQTVKAIRLETHSIALPSGHPEKERSAIAEFAPAIVESTRGAVLDGIPGFDAITLQGNLSATSSKRPLVTSYLYNGFTGEYRSCQIALDRTPDSGWRLVNRFDQTISRIVVRTRQMPVIGAYGIASLDGACS